VAQPERYVILVLGSGAGGKLLSWHQAASGHRTAVVERKWIGGSCPNVNCLPSKNEIWGAKVADLIHHAAKFGMVTGAAKIDMGGVRQRKRDMVEGLVAMHVDNYKASGAELIMAVVQTAMLGGLPFTLLRGAMLAHPTMAEGLTSLFAAVPAASR
jgi:pyruvate/2-oxoglutarate dehydrogenase complex dihydrolipoamide dehydrogenase (E3) component